MAASANHSDTARDWRASKTFSEMVDSFADPDHALANLAAKLDEMLPHYAPPVAPEPGYHEPFVLHDATLKMFEERTAQPTKGAVVKMAKELLDHRAKLTTAAPERAEKPAGCIFPKCGCRDGFCGGAYDGGPYMPTPPSPPKTSPPREFLPSFVEGFKDDGRLYKAARAIYSAGYWTADIAAGDQTRLWTELRDALGLKPGAPNKPSMIVTNTPRLSDFNGR